MKLKLLPLLIGFSLATSAPNVEAQSKTYSLDGVANITLPKGATLARVDDEFLKGWEVMLSESDIMNRVYIERKKVSKALSDAKWRSKWIEYYENNFKKYKKSLTKKTLRGVGKQVLVDYEEKSKYGASRDYTKYLRANKTTQMQAWYSAFNSNKKKVDSQWRSTEARQLRAVVDSLRAAR